MVLQAVSTWPVAAVCHGEYTLNSMKHGFCTNIYKHCSQTTLFSADHFNNLVHGETLENRRMIFILPDFQEFRTVTANKKGRQMAAL